MKLFKFIVPVFLCFFIFSCSGGVSSPAGFTLQDIQGNTVSLSDFKGKIVFVDFWASWCPPCRQSIPSVENLQALYKDNPDVVFLGININEDKDTIDRFVKEQGITYKILMADEKVLKNYKIRSIPVFFILDRQGNVRNKHMGYMPGLEAQWDQDIKFLLEK